jgi:hypothetical protein
LLGVALLLGVSRETGLPGATDLKGYVFHVKQAAGDVRSFHVKQVNHSNKMFHVKQTDRSNKMFHVKQAI